MAAAYPPVAVRVWGHWACFTRPEMKVERVTYPVMTPSAARGVLEAIYWKPQFHWQVEEIWVLNDIRYFSILRNEVNTRASDRAARRWQKEGGGFAASEDRAQRHTLALRDVAYLIRAQLHVNPDITTDPAAFRDQFRRRVRRGQCFAEPEGSEQPIDCTEELGPMLLDLDYAPDGSGRGTPRFFDARLEHGILRVPAVKGRGA